MTKIQKEKWGCYKLLFKGLIRKEDYDARERVLLSLIEDLQVALREQGKEIVAIRRDLQAIQSSSLPSQELTRRIDSLETWKANFIILSDDKRGRPELTDLGKKAKRWYNRGK